MRLVEWAQARPLAAAAGLGLLLGAIAGFAWPVTVPPVDRKSVEVWQLPAGLAAARGFEKEFSTIRDAPIWGNTTNGLNGPGADKQTVWRLTGIIADPSPAALVISEGSTDAKRLRIGGALPDSGVIREITSSSVVFERGGCVYERLLYGPVLPEENAPCDPGAQPAK